MKLLILIGLFYSFSAFSMMDTFEIMNNVETAPYDKTAALSICKMFEKDDQNTLAQMIWKEEHSWARFYQQYKTIRCKSVDGIETYPLMLAIDYGSNKIFNYVIDELNKLDHQILLEVLEARDSQGRNTHLYLKHKSDTLMKFMKTFSNVELDDKTN